jgi:hypothetical protein
VTLPPGRARLATKAGPHGISADRHNRDRLRRLLGSLGHRGTSDDDDVDLDAHELGHEIRKPIRSAFRPPMLDRDVPPLHIPQFAEPFSEGLERKRWPGRGPGAEHPDPIDLARLLRLGGEPRGNDA